MILELVTFRCRAEVSDAEFAEANLGVEEYLAGCPGFQSRELYQITADGSWLDLVHWADLASAEAAAAGIADDARCAPFLGCLDRGSATLRHATRVRGLRPDRA